MKPRAGLILALTLGVLAVAAQQAGKVYTIGILLLGFQDSGPVWWEVFLGAMRELTTSRDATSL